MTKIAGSGSESGSGSISPRHGSADPYSDPPQNVMDPQHWTIQTVSRYGQPMSRVHQPLVPCGVLLVTMANKSRAHITWPDINSHYITCAHHVTRYKYAGIRGRGHVTINQVSADTAVHPHDIALAFMLLGKTLPFTIKNNNSDFLTPGSGFFRIPYFRSLIPNPYFGELVIIFWVKVL
jgi:hypothetical protein